MSEPIKVSAVISKASGDDVDSTDLTMQFEAGNLAQQANGAVVATLGKTQVLLTATSNPKVKEGVDFLPLTVDVEERMYSIGKIPGSFFRREARAGETAILTCRLIDRSLRPSFPKDFRNDVHVVSTVLGSDQENPYDVLSINAASVALGISDIPFNGPIGAIRLAYDTEGNWIPNPTFSVLDTCTFELVVAGRVIDSDVAIMMVEAASNLNASQMHAEGAAKVDEAILVQGLEIAKEHITTAVDFQRQLMVAVGVKPNYEYEPQSDYSDNVFEIVKEIASSELISSFGNSNRQERKDIVQKVKEKVVSEVSTRLSEEPEALEQVGSALSALNKKLIREHIVNTDTRVDGRKTDELRELSASIGTLEMAHGSGLFQRGDTQVLNATTLATQKMDQIIDGLEPVDRKRFMHHYNFPPFSTGEAGFMRGPKRREIGHGALAEKAISGVLPVFEDFPYTIRLVSEVLSSNGSTSMASVCASSLSLMDAGVPISTAVAGIAMGLIYESDKYIPLTDILGEEDGYGDMDFKVAGTKEIVTALQLDTKIEGIPSDVLASALEQAKVARLQILEVMNSAIAEPRDDIKETAPKILSFEIPIDKVGEVIGPKGKVINAIQEKTGAEVSIDDADGVATVTLASTSRSAIDEAQAEIDLILNPPQAEVGKVYTGDVINITTFGAFVNIMPGTDGLLHISKLGGGKRLDKVEEAVNLGDTLTVIVDEIEKGNRGDRVSLSLANEDGTPIPGSDASHSSRPSRDRNDRSRGGGDRRNDRSRGGGGDRRNDRSRGGGGDRRNDRSRGGGDRRNDRSRGGGDDRRNDRSRGGGDDRRNDRSRDGGDRRNDRSRGGGGDRRNDRSRGDDRRNDQERNSNAEEVSFLDAYSDETS